MKYTSIESASEAGDLEELKKMHKSGYKWDWKTTANASGHGNIDSLKYKYENTYSLNSYKPENTYNICHLDCLKYAIENNCPYDINILIPNLNKNYKKIDLDTYSFLRKILFPYIDSGLMNNVLNKELNNICKSKLEEINSYKIISLEYLSDKLNKDIVKYCIHPYF